MLGRKKLSVSPPTQVTTRKYMYFQLYVPKTGQNHSMIFI